MTHEQLRRGRDSWPAIVQNVGSFRAPGGAVGLRAAGRLNREMPAIDINGYYSVKANFTIWHAPTIDLMPLAFHRRALERFAHYLILFSFSITMLARAMFTPADVVYTRDPLVALLLSLVKRHSSIAYEVHALASSRQGRALQSAALARAGSSFTISERLREDLVARGARRAAVQVARDAIREARFANAPDRLVARRDVGWPADAFIVGYVGRLHAMGVGKGAETLLGAIAHVPTASLAVVGGPDDMADALRDEWRRRGPDDARFPPPGHVAPPRVPGYLRALDVCAMPYPAEPYFALHMSPLKLFEYMASGRPIVASDLPSIAEVLKDGDTALMFAAGNIDALAHAVQRLRDDEELRESLAMNAYAEVMQHHTWAKRAELILDCVRRA